jgi:AraC-like DNA-binding protein
MTRTVRVKPDITYDPGFVGWRTDAAGTKGYCLSGSSFVGHQPAVFSASSASAQRKRMGTDHPEAYTQAEVYRAGSPLPMRRDWLRQLMDTAQVLAVPGENQPRGSGDVAAQLAAVESAQTPLEALILRGLAIEIAVRTLPVWARFVLEDHAFPKWPDAAGDDRARAVRQNDPIAKARKIIDRDFASRLSVPMVAQALRMPPAVLSRAFRRELGMSIPQYLNARRIAAAARFLATTDATIETIARDVGFRSRAAFSACFRQQTGFSPAVIRRLSHLNEHQ